MSAVLKQEKYFTYDDYLKWDTGDERFELIDGVPYAMASPGTRHQGVAIALSSVFYSHLRGAGKGSSCRVFYELDVRLNAEKRDDTVVRPDLVVVCDPSKITKNSIKGAPDLVIEVLSPSTSKHDLRRKFAKYREAGVKEIWYVDPDRLIVLVFKANSTGQYDGNIYGEDDEIPVSILPDFGINCQDIFETLEEGENEDKENNNL